MSSSISKIFISPPSSKAYHGFIGYVCFLLCQGLKLYEIFPALVYCLILGRIFLVDAETTCGWRILCSGTQRVELRRHCLTRLPVLTNEEKEQLFTRIKTGDMEARERYIKGNLRLVLSVIKRFSNSSENVDDLFQIGCVGLIKAIDNFDTTLNVKFSTYAVPMIIGEIRRYLRDNNSIRVSRSLRDTAYKAIYARENYVKQHQKEPTITEIAEEIGMEKEDIVYALDAIQSPVSRARTSVYRRR